MGDYPIKSFKMFEIVQTVEYGLTEEVIQEFVKTSWIDKYLYRIHDKEAGVKIHYHLYVKCKDSVPTDAIIKKLNKIAGKEIIKFQHISKIFGSWADVCAYATHRNSPEKFQYSDDMVVANFDFRKVIEDNEAGKSPIKDPFLRSYIGLIDSGVLTRYNIDDFMPMEHYVAYSYKLEKAFTYYEKRLKRNNKSRDDLKVYYIYGSSGTGKTTLAKYICESLNMECAISSSSNDILQDYNGEPALILDEIRPGSMRFTDLLKLLDHNTASSGAARYKNPFMDIKVVILTSPLRLEDFYKKIHDENMEPVKQLHRRIDTILEVTDKLVSVSVYNQSTNNYDFLCYFTNEIAKRFTAPQSFVKKYDILNTVCSALALSGSDPEKLSMKDVIMRYDDPVPSDLPFK